MLVAEELSADYLIRRKCYEVRKFIFQFNFIKKNVNSMRASFRHELRKVRQSDKSRGDAESMVF